MNTAQLKLYDLFRIDLKLPEAKAKEFVATIDEVMQQEVTDGSKEFRSLVSEDLLKLELKIKDVEMRLREELKDTKAEMIKWMFIFWIGQVGATIGIILLFVKK